MSALPPKADMLIVGIDVCYVPQADIGINLLALGVGNGRDPFATPLDHSNLL
jgi:hypothetical protein